MLTSPANQTFPMAGNDSDGSLQRTSGSGDRIIGFIVKHALIEFIVCAIVLFFGCLFLLMRWNKGRSRRELHPDSEEEELPVSTNATFMVVPTSAARRTAPVAAGDEALDRGVLASMPTFVYSGKELKLEPCAICWKGFKDGEKGRLIRPCFHVFHAECSDEWFRSHSTCRVCGALVGALDV